MLHNYRFRLTSGAMVDLQCGDRPDHVAVRVTADEGGPSAQAKPTMLFYQQRWDPPGYELLRSGVGIRGLARWYMARQANRFGRVTEDTIGQASWEQSAGVATDIEGVPVVSKRGGNKSKPKPKPPMPNKGPKVK